MPPTLGVIRSRIRSQLNEATARFWPDSASSGLIGWYSDGCAQQHRTVIEMARQMKRLGDLSHPYLRRFATRFPINVTEGEALYNLPSNLLEPIDVGFIDASGLEEKRAAAAKPEDDWFTKNVPQLAPTYDRPKWSLKVGTDGAVKLQCVVFGNLTIPNAPMVAALYYHRDIVRIEDLNPNATVDVNDPYNEGPVWYAIACAVTKQQGDGSGYYALAMNAAQNILGPMAAGMATGQVKQAEGATLAVAAGASRDAS